MQLRRERATELFARVAALAVSVEIVRQVSKSKSKLFEVDEKTTLEHLKETQMNFAAGYDVKQI